MISTSLVPRQQEQHLFKSPDGANLVILSTFHLNYDWARLATKYGPIPFLLEGMK